MYGHVRLNWVTHSTTDNRPGVTKKDFEVAKACNEVYKTAFGARDLNEREKEIENL